jgi:transposase
LEDYVSEFLRPKEVAERLSVSKHTIIRMVERGELDGFRNKACPNL